MSPSRDLTTRCSCQVRRAAARPRDLASTAPHSQRAPVQTTPCWKTWPELQETRTACGRRRGQLRRGIGEAVHLAGADAGVGVAEVVAGAAAAARARSGKRASSRRPRPRPSFPLGSRYCNEWCAPVSTCHAGHGPLLTPCPPRRRTQVSKRHTTLQIMPPGMQRRRENTTTFVRRDQSIAWRVEWRIHPQPAEPGPGPDLATAPYVRAVDERAPEDALLSSLLCAHVQPRPVRGGRAPAVPPRLEPV